MAFKNGLSVWVLIFLTEVFCCFACPFPSLEALEQIHGTLWCRLFNNFELYQVAFVPDKCIARSCADNEPVAQEEDNTGAQDTTCEAGEEVLHVVWKWMLGLPEVRYSRVDLLRWGRERVNIRCIGTVCKTLTSVEWSNTLKKRQNTPFYRHGWGSLLLQNPEIIYQCFIDHNKKWLRWIKKIQDREYSYFLENLFQTP